MNIKNNKILLVLFFTIMSIISCKKADLETDNLIQNDNISEISKDANAMQRNIASAITMTVSTIGNRTIPLGGSITHQIKLMNGTIPIANASVGIEDPISKACVFAKTNSSGLIT